MNTARRRALSLIEVVLAIVILGLAVSPLAVQLTVGARQQAAALIQQNLTQLASERMWEIAADHAHPSRGYSYITEKAYPDETAPRGLNGYTRQTVIREVSPTDYVSQKTGSGIKRVRIVVTGPEKRSLTVESFIADVSGSGGTTSSGSSPGIGGTPGSGGNDRRGRDGDDNRRGAGNGRGRDGDGNRGGASNGRDRDGGNNGREGVGHGKRRGEGRGGRDP